MRIVRRNLYLHEIASMTYVQRVFHAMFHDFEPRGYFKRLGLNVNPLDWCLRDVLRVLLVIATPAVFVFVIFPLALR